MGFFVKIGDEWFSPEDQAIMIWMTPEYKDLIKTMSEDEHALAAFPMGNGLTKQEKAKWMNEGREKYNIPMGKTYEDSPEPIDKEGNGVDA